MEPEVSEGAESEASESDREVEVETEEEPDVEEIKADEDVATEEYEDVVEEAAEEEPAESSTGQGKGHAASTRSQTGASPVGTTGDVGTTMNSSAAMHNLLVRSLSSSNVDNRQRIEDRLAALAERAATDHLTED